MRSVMPLLTFRPLPTEGQPPSGQLDEDPAHFRENAHRAHREPRWSVDADVSVRERLAFWAKLPDRLARLGNRVRPDEHGKIYGALHAHIPMVTPDEQRAIQEENAKDDERFWEAMRDMDASMVEGHKALIVTAEAKIAEVAPKVAKAAERRETAKDRLEKIRRGEERRRWARQANRRARRLKAEGSPSATRAECGCWPA